MFHTTVARLAPLAALALAGLFVPACVASTEPPAQDHAGTAEGAWISCPDGQAPFRSRAAYQFPWGGKQWDFTVRTGYVPNTITYSNGATDGSFFETGTLSTWSHCPAVNENVVVVRASDGLTKTCIHVCLPSGVEELHCPNGQFEMTPLGMTDICAPLPHPGHPGPGGNCPVGYEDTCLCRQDIGCPDGGT